MLNQLVYKKGRENKKCKEITVEGPGDEFQVVRNAIDLQDILEAGFFPEIQQLIGTRLDSGRRVFELSRKLTTEVIEVINHKLKLTKSQVSNCFDILLLMLIDYNNKENMVYAAYFDYLKKKTRRLNSKDLFTKVNKKFFETFGVVEPVDYTIFINTNPNGKF